MHAATQVAPAVDQSNASTTEPPLAHDVTSVARLLSVSPSKVWLLINDGTLGTIRIGRRRLVPRAALEKLLVEGA